MAICGGSFAFSNADIDFLTGAFIAGPNWLNLSMYQQFLTDKSRHAIVNKN